MTIFAVALVALTTPTRPLAPGADPPTEMFGPKFAWVTPLTKLVNLPLIVTETVCPCNPVAGEIDAIDEGGSIVSAEEFEL